MASNSQLNLFIIRQDSYIGQISRDRLYLSFVPFFYSGGGEVVLSLGALGGGGADLFVRFTSLHYEQHTAAAASEKEIEIQPLETYYSTLPNSPFYDIIT